MKLFNNAVIPPNTGVEADVLNSEIQKLAKRSLKLGIIHFGDALLRNFSYPSTGVSSPVK
jgi:hypothetical protein